MDHRLGSADNASQYVCQGIHRGRLHNFLLLCLCRASYTKTTGAGHPLGDFQWSGKGVNLDYSGCAVWIWRRSAIFLPGLRGAGFCKDDISVIHRERVHRDRHDDIDGRHVRYEFQAAALAPSRAGGQYGTEQQRGVYSKSPVSGSQQTLTSSWRTMSFAILCAGLAGASGIASGTLHG
jgi:hypothetical protein